jgi:protease-4
MSNKTLGCLGVVLVAALCASLLVNVSFLAAKGTHGSSTDAAGPAETLHESLVRKASSGSEKKIALIPLRGIISAAEPGNVGLTAIDDLKLQLEQAAADKQVAAVVLAIDSPGGEVTASDILYKAVRRVRDDSGKPVVVSMGSLAASGGYYVACGASWVLAHENTFTGSIGVIMQSLNYEQLFGKLGLETLTFKSGAFKDMLSGSRPMRDEEKAYVQAMIMQTYDQFVGIVAQERHLPEADLRKGVADGRVVSGKDALGAKLVDQLGGIEDAYAKAMELANAQGASVIRYESGFKLGRLLRMLGQSEQARVQVDLAASLAPKLETGRMYYLPSLFAH